MVSIWMPKLKGGQKEETDINSHHCDITKGQSEMKVLGGGEGWGCNRKWHHKRLWRRRKGIP